MSRQLTKITKLIKLLTLPNTTSYKAGFDLSLDTEMYHMAYEKQITWECVLILNIW